MAGKGFLPNGPNSRIQRATAPQVVAVVPMVAVVSRSRALVLTVFTLVFGIAAFQRQCKLRRKRP